MGSIHHLPIVASNIHSLQITSGDFEAAKATHQYFINGCPIALKTNSVFEPIAEEIS